MIALLITTGFVVGFAMGAAVMFLYSPSDYHDHHHHHKRKPIVKTKKATKVY
jgi:hypothetical protein